MPDAVELVKLLKQVCVEANEASKPVCICYGKVVSVIPLKISVEQKLMLGEAQLVLTRNVTNFMTKVTVEWDTEEANSHNHKISGKKTITIQNGLAVGDEVILIREQGGQKYLVVDRTG